MEYKALLICNWAYTDPQDKLKPVHGPEHNLPLLKEALAHARFGLFTAEDAVWTRSNLQSPEIGVEIENFINSAEPDDQLLFYYSGHGIRTTQGNLALCGVEVKFDNRDSMSFDTSKLRAWIDKRGRARSTILVLDCCYSGKFLGTAIDEDEVVINALGRAGEGLAVLSSGGNEPVSDAFTADSPTEFTSALTKVLLDPSLPGTNGALDPSDVCKALEASYNLPERPRLKLNQQGSLAMAKRPPTPSQPDVILRLGLPVEFETITIDFHAESVTVFTGNVEQPPHALTLDSLRKVALQRILELVDAVVRVTDDIGEDPDLELLIRRSWQGVGANLLESALPPSLHARLGGLAAPNQPTLRLRLRFDASARELARYPWEQLFLPGEIGPAASAGGPVVHPLGLRRGVMIERSLSSAEQPSGKPVTGPLVGATGLTSPRERPGPTSASVGVGAPVSGGPATGLPAATNPKPQAPLEIGVINGYAGPYAKLSRRLCREIDRIPSANLAYAKGVGGEHTNWGDVMEATELASPHCLVLMTPFQGEKGNPLMRFPSDSDDDGRRGIAEVVTFLGGLERLQLIVMINVAAPPSRDTFRRTISVAHRLSEELLVPVVFMCHTPGLERTVDQLPKDHIRTFTGTMLHALSEGKPLDQSFCYARDWVMRTLSDSSRLLFGAPGLFTHGEAHDVLER